MIKSPIFWKKWPLTLWIFLRNLERSFQTWEDGNNWPASKTLFSSFLLDDLPKNRNQFVKYWLFPLNFTPRVTWSVRSTKYNSKILLCGKFSFTVSYVLRNIRGGRKGGPKTAKPRKKKGKKTAITHRNLPKYRNRSYKCATVPSSLLIVRDFIRNTALFSLMKAYVNVNQRIIIAPIQ